MFISKLDDESIFSFSCMCCGKCCKSGLDIYLDPLDVWILRNGLKIPTYELIEKHIELEIRSEYGYYPFCLMKMDNDRCNFHKDNLCDIHHLRPQSCRLFPVAHYFEEGDRPAFALADDLIECPGLKQEKQYSVMGWVVVNKFFMHDKLVGFMPKLAAALRKKPSPENQEAIFRIMYNFDMIEDFPFANQFSASRRDNEAFVKWVIKQATAFIDGLK